MTTNRPKLLLSRMVLVLTGTFLSLVGTASAQFGPPADTTKVIYTPNELQAAQGEAPFSYRYDLQIKSPAGLPAGTTQVTMKATVLNAPAGADQIAAAGYVTFLAPGTNTPQPTFTFTGPNQTRTVSVLLSIPRGTETGQFSYRLNSLGWPAGIVDNGTNVNMHVNPPSGLVTPVVSIPTPLDGSNFTYTAGGAAIPVPISVRGEATNNAPVLALVAFITGEDENGEPFLSEVPLGISLTGLGSGSTTGTVTFPVDTPGIYTITALATNIIGTSITSSVFTVDQIVPPPVVRITQPPDASYDYYVGSPALQIPWVFEGESFEGGIRTLSATLNGVPVSIEEEDIGALIATGSATSTLSQGGLYTIVVTATDDHGVATASTSFRINVLQATPEIVINSPADGTVLTHTAGTPLLNVPFTFTVTTDEGFAINSVRARLDGSSQAVTVVTGLGTEEATGSGTMMGLSVGSHTLTAYGTSGGVEVMTSVTFTINQISPPPPSATPPVVKINTPDENSIYTLSLDRCGRPTKLTIPLQFTGTSTATGAVITKLTASLNGSNLYVSTSNLNKREATGSANMTISSPGTYTIKVTATDKHGTATATRTFVVQAPRTKQTVQGNVFFDVNANGSKNSDDYGLASVKVKAVDDDNRTVATTTTDAKGNYKFSIYPGVYTITVYPVNGMTLTTLNDHEVAVSTGTVTVPSTGYSLDFNCIRDKRAKGNSCDFWKRNIDKSDDYRKHGGQVSGSALKSYTDCIDKREQSPHKGLSSKKAKSTFDSNSSSGTAQFAKQHLAAEFNYAHGVYIDNDRALTYALVYYSGCVLKNSSSYSSSHVKFAKEWCEAYNNSNGGKVQGPRR